MTREKENGATILHCLSRVLQLLAPVAPFISEKIWQELKKKKMTKEDSVHLCSWPESNTKKIDKKLEEEFSVALKIVEKGLAARDKEKIGLRWPLAKATVSGKKVESLEEIIARQLNVKKVDFKNSKNEEIVVEIDARQTPELEAEGFSRELARKIQEERKNAGLKKGELIAIVVTCSKRLKKMLEQNFDSLKERTNAKSIAFSEDFTDDKTTFEIKEEKVGIKFH